MNAIHRLALSIRAQFEDFVDQVENHEAVAEAALNQFRGNVVNAKFRLRCLEKEIQRTGEQIRELETEAAQWKDRALKAESEDRERALECVKRMRSAQMEKTHLESQTEEMRKIHRDVAQDVRHIESQYEDLRRRHKILVSRESRAKALAEVRPRVNEAPAVFERWEARVEKSEIEGEIGNEISVMTENLDTFAEEYKAQEDRLALEALLGELRGQNKE
ncbi:MAG: PspA/IM30 family protein [Bdellovibrionaceae bacterium]|nr:PspA/IM30 family protein [Pseudobdellovibrionaceae bacterium]